MAASRIENMYLDHAVRPKKPAARRRLEVSGPLQPWNDVPELPRSTPRGGREPSCAERGWAHPQTPSVPGSDALAARSAAGAPLGR